MVGGIAVCASAQGAWYYPQMDLEIFRLEKMWRESTETGMRAAHPGKVAALRECVRFRRAKGDGSYETREIWPCFRQPACLRSENVGWEAKYAVARTIEAIF